MAKPELIAAYVAARTEVESWIKEAQRQKRNLGHIPQHVADAIATARIAAHRAQQACDADDIAHMGEAAFRAMIARDGRRR